ncbi:MAG: DotU family type IV/VI secretion system protein [Nannocystis sp.]|nr:DotU family type IV/VI secretion system protein [Nannocystis sp.]
MSPIALAQRLVRSVLWDIDLLRRVDPQALASFDPLRRRLMEDLEAMVSEAAARFGPRIAGELHYAVVALADELVQRDAGPLRDFWKPRALQLFYFRDNRAGQDVFERQDALLREPPAEGRDVALALHTLCLDLGLSGRYEREGPSGEDALYGRRIALRAELRRLSGAPASLWSCAPASGERERPSPSLSSLLTVSLTLWVLAVSLFLQVRCELVTMTGDVLSRIDAALGAV